MTRIDFYVLSETARDSRHGLACKLTEKAYRLGHKVYIHAETPGQATEIDEILWTFRAGSFLPHAPYSAEAVADHPVLIGCNLEPTEHTDVLVNLAQEVPLFFSRFERVVELVDQDAARRQNARERFRFYRERGYQLESHTISAQ